MDGAAPDLSVVIPTYLEADNIERTLAGLQEVLRATPWRWEILVADDRSPDGTADLAERALAGCGRVLRRDGPRGLGAAVGEALLAAAGRCAVVMDADGSHPPQMAERLAREVLEGRADVAVGTRYAPGGDSLWTSPLRRRISRGAARVCGWLTGLTDAGAGLFAVARDRAPLGTAREPGFKILLALLCAWPGEVRVREIPYRFAARSAGRSKFGWRVGFRFLRQLAGMLLRRPAGRIRRV